jgi:hypothetical protein
MDYGVVLFHTTSSAMRAEKVLAGEGYKVKLIPTPRQFSSDCGIALRFGWEQRKQVEATLKKNCVEKESIHRFLK